MATTEPTTDQNPAPPMPPEPPMPPKPPVPPEPPLPPAESEPKGGNVDAAKARREAAKYRARLRDAETARGSGEIRTDGRHRDETDHVPSALHRSDRLPRNACSASPDEYSAPTGRERKRYRLPRLAPRGTFREHLVASSVPHRPRRHGGRTRRGSAHRPQKPGRSTRCRGMARVCPAPGGLRDTSDRDASLHCHRLPEASLPHGATTRHFPDPLRPRVGGVSDSRPAVQAHRQQGSASQGTRRKGRGRGRRVCSGAESRAGTTCQRAQRCRLGSYACRVRRRGR
jgi:hypothetical protein